MSEFDAIRPYNDDEVRRVLDRLFDDREFLDAIARLRLPKIVKPFAALLRGYVKGRLQKEAEGVNSVRSFQEKIEFYLDKQVSRTVTEWTISGLDKLNNHDAYVFVSNHRDISMDPAFVNWAIYKNGFSTLRIAIGDNLLTKPFASDLMRLNKSFIVNRSAKGPREKLKAAKLLSKYIRHSVQQDNENIWIAQREGRAKDGLDKTNSAIISMLGLSKDKGSEFAEHIQNLKIVPVAISYEYDPCDKDKARELYEKKTHGEYVKGEQEDVQSIAKGITGFKGRVHLSFGHPLGAQFGSAEEVADEIDRQVSQNYVMHLTNCFAYEMLYKKSPLVKVGAEQATFSEMQVDTEREKFKQHVESCPEAYREQLLLGYANPVSTKLGELTQ